MRTKIYVTDRLRKFFCGLEGLNPGNEKFTGHNQCILLHVLFNALKSLSRTVDQDVKCEGEKCDKNK
jgi:hypothetical protein